MRESVAVTIDIDWAPEEAIRDCVSLFDEFGVPATVFSTHCDGVTLGRRHERALHPNFFRECPDDKVLEELADLFPDAEGIRSHGLYVYTNLREMYTKHGISYESNYLMFAELGIRPFWMYDEIAQFPICFMDDMWMRRDNEPADPIKLLENPGLTVFGFHPIHIFLNSPSIGYYERHKENYHDPDALREARHSGRGVRDIFQELLAAIEYREITAETLGELYEQFEDEHPYGTT